MHYDINIYICVLPIAGHTEPVLGTHALASVAHERCGTRHGTVGGAAHAQAKVQWGIVT